MDLRISPLGRGAVVVGLAALVAGRLLGWGELVALGSSGLLVVALGVLMSFGRSRFEVELEVAQRRLQVDERAVGRVQVRNVGAHRALAARVELPVGDRMADLWLPSLPVGGAHDDLFAVPTAHRGVVVVGPVRIHRGDPFGLVTRSRSWTEAVELFVHPRVVALAGTRPGLLRDLEGRPTRDLSDSDLSFHALREYVAGDDRRTIHWRTTARTGTLMVRQFEDTRRTRTTVALADDPADYLDDEEFELAVSVAASVAVQVVREGRELAFLAGARRVLGAGPAGVLDETARLVPVPGGDGACDLARRVAGEPPLSSVAFLIAGSRAPLAQLRASLRHAPVGLQVVVARCVVGAAPAVRVHGMATIVDVGSLSELPTVLRRVVS